MGNAGYLEYSLRKSLPSNPAMNAQQPTCNHTQAKGNPFACGMGMMLNERSTQCINQAHTQRGSINEKMFFTSIRNNARNGTKKWPKMITSPTYHQVPCSRTTYQNVSSGIFPFQMMKYCAKVMYA